MSSRVAQLFVIALVLAASPASRALQSPSPAVPTAAAPTPATPVASGAPTRRHPEEGLPFIRTYRPAEVGAAEQNWCVVQDANGVLYVGSAAGIATYDGVTWRLIESGFPGGPIPAIGPDGTIYVGTGNDFGYLATDPAGKQAFVSLHDKVPADAREHADVWRIYVDGPRVHFVANRAIYTLEGAESRVITASTRFNRAGFANGRLYVPVRESGLHVLEGGTLRLLPGTKAIGNEVTPVILPYRGPATADRHQVRRLLPLRRNRADAGSRPISTTRSSGRISIAASCFPTARMRWRHSAPGSCSWIERDTSASPSTRPWACPTTVVLRDGRS